MAYAQTLNEAYSERTVHVVAQCNAMLVLKDTSQPVSTIVSQLLILCLLKKVFQIFKRSPLKIK